MQWFAVKTALSVVLIAGCCNRVPAAEFAFEYFPEPYSENVPFDINDVGVAVGTVNAGTGQGFFRRPSGDFVTIDLPGDLTGYATGINDVRTIVGRIELGGGFVRNVSGSIELFDVPSDSGSDIGHINNLGEIVGTRAIAGRSEAFVRDPSGDFRFFEIAGLESAIGINDAGTIAGTLFDGLNYVGFLYDADSGDLEQFSARTGWNTSARGINNWRQVVGNANGRGYLRQPNGKILMIDAPGAIATDLLGINDRGQIVGYASFNEPPSYPRHGFIATPIPEPASFTLAAIIGATCLEFVFRRGNRITKKSRAPHKSVKRTAV